MTKLPLAVVLVVLCSAAAAPAAATTGGKEIKALMRREATRHVITSNGIITPDQLTVDSEGRSRMRTGKKQQPASSLEETDGQRAMRIEAKDKGKRTTCVEVAGWNAGYGECSTYAASGGHNNYWCPYDSSGGHFAEDVCQECDHCDPLISGSPCSLPSRSAGDNKRLQGVCGDDDDGNPLTEIAQGEECPATCESGYYAEPAVLFCPFTGGTLEASDFTCHPWNCASPTHIADAADPACAEGLEITHDTQCTPACAAGFTYTGSPLTCTAGTLTGSFTCDATGSYHHEDSEPVALTLLGTGYCKTLAADCTTDSFANHCVHQSKTMAECVSECQSYPWCQSAMGRTDAYFNSWPSDAVKATQCYLHVAGGSTTWTCPTGYTKYDIGSYCGENCCAANQGYNTHTLYTAHTTRECWKK